MTKSKKILSLILLVDLVKKQRDNSQVHEVIMNPCTYSEFGSIVKLDSWAVTPSFHEKGLVIETQSDMSMVENSRFAVNKPFIPITILYEYFFYTFLLKTLVLGTYIVNFLDYKIVDMSLTMSSSQSNDTVNFNFCFIHLLIV